MKKQLSVLIMISLLFITSAFELAAEQTPVQSWVVITDNHHPLQNIDVAQSKLNNSKALTVFNLDDVNALEKRISQDLPPTEHLAKKALLHRINIMGRDKFNTALINAYGGVFYSLKNNINRYPVIVFNDSFIVYGVTDLQNALEIYQQWLKKQKVNHHEQQ